MTRPGPSTVFFVFLCAAAPSFASAVETPACGSAASKCDTNFVAADTKLRVTDPDLADDYQKLYSELIALSPDAVTLEKDLPDVSAEALAEFNRRRHALRDKGIKAGGMAILDPNGELIFGTPLHTVDYYVGFSIYVLALKNVPAQYKKIASDLSALEDQARQLQSDLKGAGGGLSGQGKKPFEDRLMKLNADGTKAWDLLHADALNESDSDVALNGKKQPLMNPLQTQVAALSACLQSIDKMLNGDRSGTGQQTAPKISEALQSRMNLYLQNVQPFGPDKTAVANPPGSAPSSSASEGAAKGVLNAAYGLTAMKKTLLDLSSVPPLSPDQRPGQTGPRPAVFTGAAGEDATPAATKKVNAMRKAGQTTTIGDVDRRAGYAFHQTGNTCGIGVQVEVLADLGEVQADPKKLQAKADELYARAVALGYFGGSPADPDRREHGGTSWEHAGDLLDRPISLRYHVSEADLFKTVATGKMVIVSADSGRLWHDPNYNGQKHFIVITGVEVDRLTHKPLGYYINDTGTGEGGRFVDAVQFLQAWGGGVLEPL
jgi:hypothetical protein